MKVFYLKNNVRIWISEYISDFIEEEDSEVANLYYDYFSHIWQGNVSDLLDNYAWEECSECSSVKYDDDQYCCTSCWGSEKQDSIEKSHIANYFERNGSNWVVNNKENISLRELLKDLFSEFNVYSYILITDK